jgi:hypothetical protein
LRSIRKTLVFLVSLLACASAPAQIPSGYVQTTATVADLANGSFGAAWTSLSSSPQLALLGCQSTFQQTVNGTFDANGHFSVLLADTAQICPTPSTWTFTLVFSCPVGTPVSSFQVAVPVTGGGGTEDISAQINAALPASSCSGGGGGGTITNQIPGTIPLATGTTVIGAPSHLSDSGSVITSTEPLSVPGVYIGASGATGTPFGYSFNIFAEGDSISSSFTLSSIKNDFQYRFAAAVNAARLLISGKVGGQLAQAWSGIYQSLPTMQPGPASLVNFELGVNDAIQAGFQKGYLCTSYTSTGTSVTITANNNFTTGQQTAFFDTGATDALSALNGLPFTVSSPTSTSFVITTSLIAAGSGSTAVKASSYNQVVNFQADVNAVTAYNEYQGSPYYAQLFNYAPTAKLTLATTGTFSHPEFITGYSGEPGETCTSSSCTVTAAFTGSAFYVATGMANSYSTGITSSVVCDGVTQSPTLAFTPFAGESMPNNVQVGFTRFPLSSGAHSCVVTVSTGADLQFFIAPPASYNGRVILVNGITPYLNVFFNVNTPYPAPFYRTAASNAATTISGDGASNVVYVDQSTAFPAIASNFGDGSLHPADAVHDFIAQNDFNVLATLLGVSNEWIYPSYLGGVAGVPGPAAQGANYNFDSSALRLLKVDTAGNGSQFNTGCDDTMNPLASGDYNTACGAQSLADLVGYLGAATGAGNITLGGGGSNYVPGDVLTLAQVGATTNPQVYVTGTSSGTITTFNMVPGVFGSGLTTASGIASTGGSGVGATFNITTLGAPPIHAVQNTAYGEGSAQKTMYGNYVAAFGTDALGTLNGGGGYQTALGTNACALYNPHLGSTIEQNGTCVGYNSGVGSTFPLGQLYLASNGQTDNHFVTVGDGAGKFTPFVLTNDFIAIGSLADVMGDFSAEIGTGNNPYTHTLGFRARSIADDDGNLNGKLFNTTATTLVSGSTIVPLSSLVTVSGTNTINTITPPTVPWGTAAQEDNLGSTTYSLSGGILTIASVIPWPWKVGQPIGVFGGASDGLAPLYGAQNLTVASVSGNQFTINTSLVTGSGSTGAGFVTSSLTGPFVGCMDFLASGAWSTTTAGNISEAFTAAVGTAYHFCYDGSKWNPPPGLASTTPTVGGGVCWKTTATLGTCTAGTWPSCTTCN